MYHIHVLGKLNLILSFDLMQLPGFVPIQRRKASIAAVIVVAMVIASAIGVELITAGLFACAGLLIFRCLTPRDAMVLNIFREKNAEKHIESI